MIQHSQFLALDSDLLSTVSGGAKKANYKGGGQVDPALTTAMTQIKSSLDGLITQQKTTSSSSSQTMLPMMMMMSQRR